MTDGVVVKTVECGCHPCHAVINNENDDHIRYYVLQQLVITHAEKSLFKTITAEISHLVLAFRVKIFSPGSHPCRKMTFW